MKILVLILNLILSSLCFGDTSKLNQEVSEKREFSRVSERWLNNFNCRAKEKLAETLFKRKKEIHKRKKKIVFSVEFQSGTPLIPRLELSPNDKSVILWKRIEEELQKIPGRENEVIDCLFSSGAKVQLCYEENLKKMRSFKLSKINHIILSVKNTEDFRGQDLRGRDLSHKNLRGANFEGVDLERVNLDGSDLTGAKLKRANFRKILLWNVNFFEADLSEAILEECWIKWTYFNRANLFCSKFKGATLIDCDLNRACLLSSDLSSTLLYRSYFYKANLMQTNLKNANIYKVCFIKTDLRRAIIVDVSDEGTDYKEAKTKGMTYKKGVSTVIIPFYVFCEVKTSS